jgi:hypothetical protein
MAGPVPGCWPPIGRRPSPIGRGPSLGGRWPIGGHRPPAMAARDPSAHRSALAARKVTHRPRAAATSAVTRVASGGARHRPWPLAPGGIRLPPARCRACGSPARLPQALTLLLTLGLRLTQGLTHLCSAARIHRCRPLVGVLGFSGDRRDRARSAAVVTSLRPLPVRVQRVGEGGHYSGCGLRSPAAGGRRRPVVGAIDGIRPIAPPLAE